MSNQIPVIERLEIRIAAHEACGGGKVLLPVEEAREILALLKGGAK